MHILVYTFYTHTHEHIYTQRNLRKGGLSTLTLHTVVEQAAVHQSKSFCSNTGHGCGAGGRQHMGSLAPEPWVLSPAGCILLMSWLKFPVLPFELLLSVETSLALLLWGLYIIYIIYSGKLWKSKDFFHFKIFLIVYMYICLYVQVPKEALKYWISLELELQRTENHLMWVPRNSLWLLCKSSTRY